MDPDDQLAVRRIASIGTPEAAAFEAPAPLVECAEKTELSIPAEEMVDLIHLLRVEDVAAVWGFLVKTNSELQTGDLKVVVRDQYLVKQFTGQHGLPSNFSIEKD